MTQFHLCLSIPPSNLRLEVTSLPLDLGSCLMITPPRLHVHHELTIEFKFRVSTYNIRALTYNIKEFL